MKKITCWILGSSGRMGTELSVLLKDHPEWQLIGVSNRSTGLSSLETSLSKIDIIFDFSSPDCTENLHHLLCKAGPKPSVLIGTTGHSQTQLALWEKNIGKIRALLAPNTSIGILWLRKILAQHGEILRSLGFDVEILETHHTKKKRSPIGYGACSARFPRLIPNDSYSFFTSRRCGWGT